MKQARVIAAFLCGAILFLSQTPARAQDASDPRQWSDNLFQTLVSKGEDAFSAELKETMMGQETEATGVLVGTVAKTRKFGGALTGYEYISQQQMGLRLRRLKYATYNERFFLIVQLAFYKTDKGWELFGADMNSQSDNIPWE